MTTRIVPAFIHFDTDSIGGQALADALLKSMQTRRPPRFPRGWKVTEIMAARNDIVRDSRVATVQCEVEDSGLPEG